MFVPRPCPQPTAPAPASHTHPVNSSSVLIAEFPRPPPPSPVFWHLTFTVCHFALLNKCAELLLSLSPSLVSLSVSLTSLYPLSAFLSLSLTNSILN